jgi:hypothetical protein
MLNLNNLTCHSHRYKGRDRVSRRGPRKGIVAPSSLSPIGQMMKPGTCLSSVELMYSTPSPHTDRFIQAEAYLETASR